MTEHRTMMFAEWWCPTEQKWSDCSGPCPDGTPHGPKRNVERQVRVLSYERYLAERQASARTEEGS